MEESLQDENGLPLTDENDLSISPPVELSKLESDVMKFNYYNKRIRS